MTKSKALNAALRTTAAVLSLTLSSVPMVTTAALMVTPAYAQTVTITADQAAGIQTNLASAIAAVNTQGLTGAALTSALEAAIAQVETSSVSTYGAGAAGSVTSAVLAAPALASMSPALIGTALGDAAATVAANQGVAAATAIGITVANEGPTGSQLAFASAVTASGGPISVADAGTGAPSAAGSLGGAGGGGGTGAGPSGLVTTGSGGGGCANPSCT